MDRGQIGRELRDEQLAGERQRAGRRPAAQLLLAVLAPAAPGAEEAAAFVSVSVPPAETGRPAKNVFASTGNDFVSDQPAGSGRRDGDADVAAGQRELRRNGQPVEQVGAAAADGDVLCVQRDGDARDVEVFPAKKTSQHSLIASDDKKLSGTWRFPDVSTHPCSAT